MNGNAAIDDHWLSFTERYQRGEWRAPIFRDLILADMASLGPPRSLSVLDIGCGKGFDDNLKLQTELASAAGRYWGVEPDSSIQLNPVIEQVSHCLFEDAQLGHKTVDVAFCVMVLEHLAAPCEFFKKLHEVLREGGVFWGFTVDSRHWFATASMLAKKLRFTDWYLNLLQGKAGESRYENYAVYYRSNTPEQLKQLTTGFRSTAVLNFHRIGQMDYYLPKGVRWLGRLADRYLRARGLPGSILAVRVVR